MPHSGCLALHGVNPNLKKKKKKVIAKVMAKVVNSKDLLTIIAKELLIDV